MKMVKKILLGTLAVAAVLSLASCGKIDDNKDNVIKKNSSTKYSVDYSNDSGTAKRAFESTSLNHAGALVKVKFDNGSATGTSKMGVIFNLKEADGKRDFFIIGLGGNNNAENFYVSKMENITDIQAQNFGASTTAAAGKPKETEYVALTAANKKTLPINTDGSVTVYVYFKAKIDGSYDWYVLNLTETEAAAVNMNETLSVSSTKVIASGNIPNAFTAVDAEAKIPQSKHAVYAQVAPNKSLKGSWEYVKTYKEAEEIEE